VAIYTPEYQPNGNEIAVITTDRGTIRVKLAGKDAPIHVGNFVELARKGFYNGLRFHRYEPGFVIQGGCPNSRDGATGMPGTGGPGYQIKGEWTVNPNNYHKDGTLAMARSSAPDSAGSQFYFCLGAQSFLDGNYTVFGDPEDEQSLQVIHSLQKGDEIKSIEIENAD
jgi:peptidyl-prolyl cis-trans isomerase B (cyclophilin B)